MNVPIFPGPDQEAQDGKKACVENCTQPWEVNGQHCYFWSNDSKSWEEAEKTCREKGGHLASVRTNATNNYILEEWDKRNPIAKEHFWIGGTDEEKEGVWKWIDGRTWQFTYWASDRPGGTTGINANQNCLQYERISHKWYDFRCKESEKFLCSRKICSAEEADNNHSFWIKQH